MSVNKTDRWGGFRFTKLRTMGGRETEAYSAIITFTDGTGKTTEVGTSGNDGNGGADSRYFTDKTAGALFEEFAQALYPEDNFEVADHLANDLVTVATLNRSRNAVIIDTTPEVFWDWSHPDFGNYMKVNTPADAATVEWLKNTRPEARIWSKTACDFVPLDQF